MNHRSLRTHLTLAFAVMAIVPVLILGTIQVQQINKLTQEYNKTQEHATKRLADAVETYVYYYRNAVDTLATTISASGPGFRDRAGLTRKIQSVKNNLPGFSQLYVTDENGAIKALSPEAESANAQALPVGGDLSPREYWKKVKLTLQPAISVPMHGAEGGSAPFVAIAAPLYSESRAFEGVVIGILDMGQIARLVTQYDYGPGAYPAVLGPAGRVIYHPREELVQSIADLSGEPAVQAAASLKEGMDKFASAANGQKELVSFKTIDSLGWTVWVGRSYAAVQEAFFASLKSTFLLLLLTLGLTALLGSYLAKRLNRTIHALVRYTQSLAADRYTVPSEPLSSSGAPYEMHYLATQFAQMAEQIHDNRQALLELNSELEQRVEERTLSLQQQHATLAAVLESYSDGIVLIDVNQQVVLANRRMAELFGFDGKEVLSLTEEELLRRIARKMPQPAEDFARMGRKPNPDGKFTLLRSPGDERVVQLASFQVTDDSKEFGRGYVFRDMTKEHEIDTLKNDLISLASHEFKTPITSIKGSVETLLRKHAGWDEEFKQELLEGIHEDIGRIQELIDEWLDISKIEAGALSIHPAPVRIRSVVEGAWQRLPHTLSAEAQLHLDLDEELPLLYADKRRMEQIFINLFTNSIRYNESKPHIRVIAEQEGLNVRILVKDNGIGIPEAHLPHIFDRFYRVDVSSSRRTGGTGLGLAICKGIIDAHGGSIEVRSTEGAGTTMIVTVPSYYGQTEDDHEEA